MDRFTVDADRILLADGETVEFFWRGTNSGSSKWRFHVSQMGAELALKRKGDEVAVKLGDSYGRGIAGDVVFDLPLARVDELKAFLAGAGVRVA